MTYLSLIVLIPLAAVTSKAFSDGLHGFWVGISNPQSVAALKLTLTVSLIVALINAIAGTAIAWVLVRDEFRGRGVVDTFIDLPFALPTIVAGITLLTLYGPNSPVGINVAFTQTAIALALLFVTLPFVVRTVQPVLYELDREMEEAAASLGAGTLLTFRRIILPTMLPAILSGVALAFARAIGEYGSIVIISGNLPYRTQVSSVFIVSQLGYGNTSSAAAESVLLLGITLFVLLGIGGFRHFTTRHQHA